MAGCSQAGRETGGTALGQQALADGRIKKTPNAEHRTPNAAGSEASSAGSTIQQFNGSTRRREAKPADDGIRTRDLRFTKPLLYQLSYVGGKRAKHCIQRRFTQAGR